MLHLLAALSATAMISTSVAVSATIAENFYFPRQPIGNDIPLPSAKMPWTFYIPAGDIFEPGGTSFLTVHALGDHGDPNGSPSQTGAPNKGWALYAVFDPLAPFGTPIVLVQGVIGTSDSILPSDAFEIPGIPVSNDLLNLAVNATTGEVTLSARLGYGVRQDHSSFTLQGQTIPEPNSMCLIGCTAVALSSLRRVRRE